MTSMLPPTGQGRPAPVAPEQRMFDWENLRHYLAYVRTRSLSGAARELGVEHATVARRIAALELALNAKLLDRRQRQYRLTPLGHRVAEIGQRINHDALGICRIARSARDELLAQLSISAPPLLTSTFVAPHLSRLRQEHPAINLSFLPEVTLTERDTLTRPQPDVLISLQRPEQTDMVVRRLASLSYGLYAAPAYAKTHRGEQYEYIDYDDAMDSSPQYEWLREISGERPIVLRARSLEVRAAAVRNGLGVALLPDFHGRQDSRLQRLEHPGPALIIDVWLGIHAELRTDPAVRAVMDFLIGCFPDNATV